VIRISICHHRPCVDSINAWRSLVFVCLCYENHPTLSSIQQHLKNSEVMSHQHLGHLGVEKRIPNSTESRSLASKQVFFACRFAYFGSLEIFIFLYVEGWVNHLNISQSSYNVSSKRLRSNMRDGRRCACAYCLTQKSNRFSGKKLDALFSQQDGILS